MFSSDAFRQALSVAFVYLFTIVLLKDMFNVLSPYYSEDTSSEDEDHLNSIVGLEKLFQTEVTLLRMVDELPFINTQRTDVFEREINKIEWEYVRASEYPEQYLENPVYAYLLIKRLDCFWAPFIEKLSTDTTPIIGNLTLPTSNDVKRSVLALIHIEETYKLEVHEIASGIINGVNYGTSMGWHDCFFIGQLLLDANDLMHAKLWLLEAVKLFRLEVTAKEDKTLPMSLDWLDCIALMTEKKPACKTNLPNKIGLTDLDLVNVIRQLDDTFDDEFENVHCVTRHCNLYDRICRGEVKPPPWKETELRCRYFHRDVPYRLLMPFKMEEISLDPYVVHVHDVLSDDEITAIVARAKFKMKYRQIFNEDSTHIDKGHRTSQDVSLEYASHPVLEKLVSKLSDITGVSGIEKDGFLVSNYVIGGHSLPIYDKVGNNPDMIAKATFSLSHVEHGGDIAFLNLKKAVKLHKGSMLLSETLGYAQDSDKHSRANHADCPVMKGSKWTANFNIIAEEFICHDNRNHIEYMKRA